MNNNIHKQFEQFFRMFNNIVNDFDDYSWNHSGHCLTVPTRLSWHILQSIKYYSNDKSDFVFRNSNNITHDYKYNNQFQILQSDIISNSEIQKNYIVKWINEIDLSSINEQYKWTGNDLESVVIFIIRHNYFHLGELNALLNEYLGGKAKDHFADNIW